MLTHGRYKAYYDEGVIRFTKSPFDQPPMYWNNVEYKKIDGIHFEVPVRRRNEIKDTGTPGHGQNDTTHGISRKGIRAGDTSQQTSLFDIH
jgi:hypothetical protein